jgi:hypothetical protein
MENDFVNQVSQYDDASLLKMLETPFDLESEEYAAVLLELFDRKVISQQEFDDYFSGIEKEDGSITFETEPDYSDEESEIFGEEDQSDDPNDYWKCPICGELIENTFDACWKCQNDQPEVIQRPNVQEVIESKKVKLEPNFAKTGFSSMGISAVALIVSFVLRYEPGDTRYVWWIVGMSILAVGFLFGFILVIKGFTEKDNQKSTDQE